MGIAYTAGTQFAGSGLSNPIQPYYAANISTLPSGNTISALYFSGTTHGAAVVVTIADVPTSSVLDNQGAGSSSSGGGTAPSVTEGSVTQNKRVVCGFIYIYAGATDSFSEASGWTTEGSFSDSGGGAGTNILRVACKIVNTPSQQTYNPMLGTSRAYAVNVISIKTN